MSSLATKVPTREEIQQALETLYNLTMMSADAQEFVAQHNDDDCLFIHACVFVECVVDDERVGAFFKRQFNATQLKALRAAAKCSS